ncbi:MAG: MBL fold metallo-hydrolase [Alphaproteobacteria bacterium]|nr:MBL fold metallo-hydrolase [Alphaproteobacteria bacterium]
MTPRHRGADTAVPPGPVKELHVRIGFVGHASIAVDTRGIRVLSDPWWSGPCFGTQWWVHPAPALDLVRARDPDFIYISHGHHDHLHFGTLQRLPKTAKVLVGRELDLAASTRDAGFETIELDARVPTEIAPSVHVEIAPTHAGDSYMMIADGTSTCLNLNDALHAAPDAVVARTIDDLRARYGRVDYVFCGYGIASHFPAC